MKTASRIRSRRTGLSVSLKSLWCHLPVIRVVLLPGDESYDDFNENGDDNDSGPPPARSGGQGGLGGLSYSDQIALLERRKRLK